VTKELHDRISPAFFALSLIGGMAVAQNRAKTPATTQLPAAAKADLLDITRRRKDNWRLCQASDRPTHRKDHRRPSLRQKGRSRKKENHPRKPPTTRSKTRSSPNRK